MSLTLQQIAPLRGAELCHAVDYKHPPPTGANPECRNFAIGSQKTEFRSQECTFFHTDTSSKVIAGCRLLNSEF